MATYYAYAASNGNWTWNSTNTTNFYTGSGGTGVNGTAPTASDTVIFDSNSGTGTVTWSSGVCLTLLCMSGYTGTLGNGSSTHSIPGSWTTVSGMTYNGTGTITFTSTSSGNTITTGGQQMPNITFNGAGGVWTLQDTLNASGKTVTLTAGDLECNGQTLNIGILSSSNSNTRTLNISNCTLNINGTGTVLSFLTQTNLTLTTTGSQINITDTSSSNKSQGGAGTWNNLNITGGAGTFTISNSPTFTGNITNTAGNNINIIIGGSTITYNSMTLVGNGSWANNSVVSSASGTRRSMVGTVNSTWSNVFVQDMNFTSATVNDTTGGYSGGNNTGITFPNPYLLQTATNSVASSASTLTKAYARNTTAGSLLLCAVICGSGTVSSVTDAQSNTYNQVATATNGTYNAYLYAAYNTAGGSLDTVTVNLSGTGLVVAMTTREYGGLTTSPLDQTGSATGTTGNISVSTSNSTVNPLELVIGVGTDITSTDTMSVGTGYTNFINNNTQTTAQIALEELVVSSTGTQTATFTNSVTSTWAGLIATFLIPSSYTPHFLTTMGIGG